MTTMKLRTFVGEDAEAQSDDDVLRFTPVDRDLRLDVDPALADPGDAKGLVAELGGVAGYALKIYAGGADPVATLITRQAGGIVSWAAIDIADNEVIVRVGQQ